MPSDNQYCGQDICRKSGISQATYFNWKKKYA
ncbi:transposase, partial [Brucella intermedia]